MAKQVLATEVPEARELLTKEGAKKGLSLGSAIFAGSVIVGIALPLGLGVAGWARRKIGEVSKSVIDPFAGLAG